MSNFFNWLGYIFPASSYENAGSDVIYTIESFLPKPATEDMIISSVKNKIRSSLISEEGFRDRVYLDSLGYKTGGIGHLLTGFDKIKYKVGDLIPNEIIEKWYKNDTEKALNASILQAKELGKFSESMILGLFHVNFQLGTGWRSKHPRTWNALKTKNAKQAIKELNSSLWAKQTPKRVQNFINVINSNYG